MLEDNVEKYDSKKRRKGISRPTETANEKIPIEIKNLVYSRVGYRQPTSSRG